MGSLQQQLMSYPTPAAGGAVTPDTSQFVNTVTNSYSASYTTAGSNRYLVVGIVVINNTISTPTYNSVSMTSLGTGNLIALVDVKVALYGLVAPTSGAHTLAISFGGPPDQTYLLISSWNGVNQATPTGTFVSDVHDAVDGTTTSLSLTSSATGMCVDVLASYARTMAANAGQTEVGNSGSAAPSAAGSYKTGSATTSMGWTISSGNQIRSEIGIPLIAA